MRAKVSPGKLAAGEKLYTDGNVYGELSDSARAAQWVKDTMVVALVADTARCRICAVHIKLSRPVFLWGEMHTRAVYTI